MAFRKLTTPHNSKKRRQPRICYYPVFSDVKILNDHVARAAWYLSCMNPAEIIFLVQKGVLPEFKAPGYFDESVNRFIASLKNRINVIEIDTPNSKIYEIISEHQIDFFMLWDQRILDDEKLKSDFNMVRNDAPVWRVDNSKVRFEGSHYIKAGLDHLWNRDGDIDLERRKFVEKTKGFKNYEKAYLFCTGPNVSKYKKHDYSDGLSIICNSIIFDDEMMEYIKPQVLCFSDSIFHFGPSRYAAEYFKKLREVILKYDLLLFTHFNYYRIINHNYPECADRTIAIPIDYEKPFSYNLLKDFYINPFGSVLHLLMLPIASTFTNKINILGADGKRETDNKYFWSHNKKTQINDQMDNMRVAHPSFFDINYSDFYEKHKEILKQYINEGEMYGKYYASLTESYIPCLKERYFISERDESVVNKSIAVYDPGFNEFGHSENINILVARILAVFFVKVIVFDEHYKIKSAFNNKPNNVEIMQLDDSLCCSHLRSTIDNYLRNFDRNKTLEGEGLRINLAEKAFYEKVFRYIENIGCDLIFLTSEASMGNQFYDAFSDARITTPYIILCHIVWRLIENTNNRKIKNVLKNAECLFVLEDFLIDPIKPLGKKTFRFPHCLHESKPLILSDREKNTDLVKIGTIGVINERRNVLFLLESLNNYNGTRFEYHLSGNPIGEEGQRVVRFCENFNNASNVELTTDFRYFPDAEYIDVIKNMDFLLIAYDQKRRYQASGSIHQFFALGKIVIAPNVEPFMTMEKQYPGLFILYENLSTESLNSLIDELSQKNKDYHLKKTAAKRAMRRFVLDNAKERQLTHARNIFRKIFSVNDYLVKEEKTKSIIKNILSELYRADKRFLKILIKERFEESFKSEKIIGLYSSDNYIKRINEGSDILDEISRKGLIEKICSNKMVFETIKDCFEKCVEENRDILTYFSDSFLIENVFGSQYNMTSRTDKYYKLWGKLFGAYEISKAVNDYDTVDKPRLAELKDAHKGKRGFIICNGPSLNSIDLSLLKDEITIGMNNLYLLFKDIAFRPTYYVIEDELVGEDRREDINSKINGPLKFFPQRLAYCIERGDDVVFLRHNPDGGSWHRNMADAKMDMRFSQDISEATYSGNTATYTCLQIMFHLGVDEVYLIGADHSYRVPERYRSLGQNDNYVIDSQEMDLNHFNSTYFGIGCRWHNPKVHLIENAYRNARVFFESNKRKIINATIGGKLEQFERTNFNELFPENSKRKTCYDNKVLKQEVPSWYDNRNRYDKNQLINNERSLFLLANGASMANIAFNKFEKMDWVGMNADFEYWEMSNVYPDYYICLNKDISESHKESIYNLINNRHRHNIKLFFLRKAFLHFYRELEKIPEILFFDDYFSTPYFDGVTQGMTADCIASLFGAMMGYKIIFLLGIDLNHFQENSEEQFYKSWETVKSRLDLFGVNVYNCNPESKLKLFNFADIDKILV